MMRTKKAQVWSLDFIVSLMIFMAALIPLFFAWNYVNMQNQQQIMFGEAENQALQVTDALVRTRGLPEGWDQTSVNVIGLASEENVLNATKVSYLLSMGGSDYERTRAIMTGGYDFFLNITDINGTVHGTIGTKPEGSAIIPVERYCICNGRITKIEFAIVI